VFRGFSRTLWGEMRWWLNGRELKHDGEYADVRGATGWGMDWLTIEADREIWSELATAEDAMIHFSEYSHTDPDPGEVPYWLWPVEEQLRRQATEIDHIGVQALLDCWRIVSVRTPKGDWILARELNTRELIDHHIPAGETRRVVEQFCTWMIQNHCARPKGWNGRTTVMPKRSSESAAQGNKGKGAPRS
jgi:hypothetical protein